MEILKVCQKNFIVKIKRRSCAKNRLLTVEGLENSDLNIAQKIFLMYFNFDAEFLKFCCKFEFFVVNLNFFSFY